VGGPNHPSSEVEQVLQPATQPPAEELIIDMEITETSPKMKLNMRTDDNYKLFENHDSFVKPAQPEENLKEIPNIDEELLANHDEAKVEPDVKQLVAAEILNAENSDQVLDAEDSPQYTTAGEAVQVQVIN
jgi:hypothetical protein